MRIDFVLSPRWLGSVVDSHVVFLLKEILNGEHFPVVLGSSA